VSPAVREIQLERVRPQPCSNPNSNTETRYRVLFEGNEIGLWRDPEHSAARYLVDHGRASREDTLRTWRGDTPCLKGKVGWFAGRRVKEDDRAGIRVARWTPNPWAALPRMGQKPACAAPAGVWVQHAPAGVLQSYAPAPAWVPR
jgi:hypothetical protein